MQLRVRELAEARGMNLSQLQRRADIGMRTARRYWFETNNGNTDGDPLVEINTRVLEQIAAALEVDARDLIRA